MKRSVSVKFILTIAKKAKSKTTDHWLSPHFKTIFFFFVYLPDLHKGELLFRESKNSQPKAIFLLTLTRGKDPFISRKKKRKCRSCTKKKVMTKSLTQPMAFDS